MWWIAIAQAAANQIGYLQRRRGQEDELRRQKGMAQEAYRYQREYSDAGFNLQRGEALEALGIQKNRLAQAFGADVEGFNLGLEGQAVDAQQARVSLAEGAGAALAARGAGGTRGGGSLDMQIGFQERQFARREDLQGRANSLGIQNMARSYTNEFDDIGREVDSWGAGGWRYQAKELSDAYAAQMHGLKMRDYDAAIDDNEFNFWDFMTAGLSGAGQGAQTGQQIEELWAQRKKKE